MLSFLAAEDAYRETPELHRFAETGNEVLLFQIAVAIRGGRDHRLRGALPSTNPEWTRLTRKLLARAISQAEAEGHYWTPLLDMLAGAKAWEGTYYEDLPSPAQQAAKLVPWLESRPARSDVEKLLNFRSLAIREVLVSHARDLSDATLVRLATTQELAEKLRTRNPGVGQRLDEDLLRSTLLEWEPLVARPWDYGLSSVDAGEKQANIVLDMLRSGSHLPPDLWEHLFSLIASHSNHSSQAIAMLLADSATGPAKIERLAAMPAVNTTHYLLTNILLHDACPDTVWKRFAAGSQTTVASLLTSKQFSAERIAWLLASQEAPIQEMSVHLAAAFCDQRSLDEDQLVVAAKAFSGADRTRIFTRLCRNPSAVRHPTVRKELLKSRSVEVLTEVLSAWPESPDFERTALRLYRVAAANLIDWLENHPLPRPLGEMRTLSAALLTSTDPDIRRFAIELLGRRPEQAPQPTPSASSRRPG